MLLESHGHRFLLSGDAEPEEEDDILAEHADLDVDVFKVAHHGSANQDPDFVLDTSAALAVISVGADNDYGHPAPETLALLDRLGAITYRTDQDGDDRDRRASRPARRGHRALTPPRVAGKVASTRRAEPDLSRKPRRAGDRIRAVGDPWHADRIMAKQNVDTILGTTTLITGSDEFLAERTIGEMRDAVKAADADADLSELDATELGVGALAEISSPSLFAAMRCVVVRRLEELPDDAVDRVGRVRRHAGARRRARPAPHRRNEGQGRPRQAAQGRRRRGQGGRPEEAGSCRAGCRRSSAAPQEDRQGRSGGADRRPG